MEVKTKAYGNIEVSERQMISLSKGLFGFEGLTEFVLIDAKQKPFLILQSLEDVEVAFILIDPGFFRDDYIPSISSGELEEIGLAGESEENCLILAVVTIPSGGEGPITANLQGPLVLNREKRTGRQFIAGNPQWETRHNILEELARKRTAQC